MRILVLALMMVMTALPARAGERVAIVIGNSAYGAVGRLPNPVRDATAMAAALRGHGFDVMVLADADRAGMDEALRAFRAKADAADIALVYFAGHGIEIDGTNYLIPTDAKLVDQRDVPSETISLDMIVRQISGAKLLKMVVLDACRNNPYLSRMVTIGPKRNRAAGLAAVSVSIDNTLIAYAAAAGAVTPDGPEGGNSPYTAAFLEALAGPRRDVSLMMRTVRDGVRRRIGPDVSPFVYSSLGSGEIVLNANSPPAIPGGALPDFGAGEIAEAQTVLAGLGLYGGAADGEMTEATAEAIRAFQARSRLPITSKPDRATLFALRAAASFAAAPPAAGDTATTSDYSATIRPATPTPVSRVWSGTPWIRRYGDFDTDTFLAASALPDGGYAFAGATQIGGRATAGGMLRKMNGWLVRTDSEGRELWRQIYGGPGYEKIRAMAVLPDGGFVLAGLTSSIGAGSIDGWLMRVDAKGEEIWSRAYGTEALEQFDAVAVLPDGGIVAAGFTTGAGEDRQAWLVRTDAKGDVLWQRAHGGQESFNQFMVLAVLDDGDFLLAGRHGKMPWVLRTGPDGRARWDRTYEARDMVMGTFSAIAALPDGGAVLAGRGSFDGHITFRGRIVRIASGGDVVWERRLDGWEVPFEQPRDLLAATPDGGFLAAFTGGKPLNEQVHLARFGPDGAVVWQRALGSGATEIVSALTVFADGSTMIAGATEGYGANSVDALVMRLTRHGEGPEEAGLLRRACIGDAVRSEAGARAVQNSLAARGFNVTVDGRWGAGTTQALAEFRAAGGCEDPALAEGE